MDFDKLVDIRVSSRKFTDKKVSRDDIKKLLHAGVRAPIASGEYEKSHITVIEDEDLLKKIVGEFNEKMDTDRNPLYGSGLFILFSSAKDTSARFEDAGCVIENIHLKATDLGLGSCYIRGMVNSLGDKADYIKDLDLPEGFTPVSGIAIGHVENLGQPKDNKIEINFI